MTLDFKEATEGLTDDEIRRVVTMTTDRFFNRRINEALGEYADYGFSLKKSDYNTVDLYFKDKKLATYYTDKATMANTQEGCRNYLKSLARSA